MQSGTEEGSGHIRDHATPSFYADILLALRWCRLNVQHFFVAVDPSGGGASAFSICSAITLENGSIQVCLQLR